MKNFETIRKILAGYTAEEDITLQSKIKEDLGLDSLSLVSFLVELEEALGFELDMSDLDPEKISVVADIVKLTEVET